MPDSSSGSQGLIIGLAALGSVAAVAYMLYRSCGLKAMGIAPLECQEATPPPNPPLPPGAQPPPTQTECVPNYESIQPGGRCCKQDGSCCAREDDSIVWPKTSGASPRCYPALGYGAYKKSSQNPDYATVGVQDFEWYLRSDQQPVYIGTVVPRIHWTITNQIERGEWCDAYYEWHVIEEDGSLTFVTGNRYPGDSIKNTNGFIEVQSALNVIQRPIKGFMARVWLHIGFACAFGSRPFNIADWMEVRVL